MSSVFCNPEKLETWWLAMASNWPQWDREPWEDRQQAARCDLLLRHYEKKRLRRHPSTQAPKPLVTAAPEPRRPRLPEHPDRRCKCGALPKINQTNGTYRYFRCQCGHKYKVRVENMGIHRDSAQSPAPEKLGTTAPPPPKKKRRSKPGPLCTAIPAPSRKKGGNLELFPEQPDRQCQSCKRFPPPSIVNRGYYWFFCECGYKFRSPQQ